MTASWLAAAATEFNVPPQHFTPDALLDTTLTIYLGLYTPVHRCL